VLEGAATLNAAAGYDVRALVVLTDGVQNTSPMLADVTSSITANTFAVGLGLPANLNVAALSVLTQGHNGYLLITGAVTPDQRTRLTKYFLQILAGITNAAVVVDPSGQLPPGTVHRIPFDVTEADYGLDVFVLTPEPKWLECVLETPDGTLIDAGVLAAEGTGEQAQQAGLWLYRLVLPAIPSRPDGSHQGRWYVLLRAVGGGKGRYTSEYSAARYDTAVPYDVVVHAYSSLELRGWLTQPDYAPGTSVSLTAQIFEYSRVMVEEAKVWADITDPSGSLFGANLTADAAGTFTGSFVAPIPGVYRVRLRAAGTTSAKLPFTRELTLTAAVREGGEPPDVRPDPWCDVLRCLISNPETIKRFGGGAELVKCLETLCRSSHSAAAAERHR